MTVLAPEHEADREKRSRHVWRGRKAGVVREVSSHEHRGRLRHRRREREVPGGDHADGVRACRRVDLRVVGRSRTGGTDHDGETRSIATRVTRFTAVCEV